METKEDVIVEALTTKNQIKVAEHQDENTENTVLERGRVTIDGENCIVLESVELMEGIALMSIQNDQIIKELKAENKETLDDLPVEKVENNNAILEMEILKTEIGEDNNNVKIIGLQTQEPLAEHVELHCRNNDITCNSYESGMSPLTKFNPFLLDDERIPGSNREQVENVSKIYENISDVGFSSNQDSGQAFAHAIISNGVENWHRFDEDDVAERNIYEDRLVPSYVEANGSFAMFDNKHEPELWEKLLDDHSLNHENGEGEVQDFEWQDIPASPGNPFFGRLSSFLEPDAIRLFEFNGNPMQGPTNGKLNLFPDPDYTTQTDAGANLNQNGASSSEERTNPWISSLEMEDLREVEIERQHTQTPTDIILSREGKAFERDPEYTTQTDVGTNLNQNGASSSEERTKPWISSLEMEDLREVEIERQHAQTPTDLILSRKGKAFERDPEYTTQTDVGANLNRNGASSSEERTNPWISSLEMEDLREVETERQHTQTPTDLILSREGKAFERECEVKSTTLPIDAHLQKGQKLKYYFHDFVSPWQSPTPSPPRLTSSLSSPEQRESAKRKSFSSLSELRRSWTWTSPKLRSKGLAGLSPLPTKKMLSAREKKVSYSSSVSNSIIKVVQKKLHGDNMDCIQKLGSSESREGIEHKAKIDENPTKAIDVKDGESKLSFHRSFSEETLSEAMREDLVRASMGKYCERNFSKGLDSLGELEVGKMEGGKERFESSIGSTFWDPFMSPRQSEPSSLTGVTSSLSSPASPNRASVFISPPGSQSQSASPMPEWKASVNLLLQSGSNKKATSSKGKKKAIALSPAASPFIKRFLRKARSGPVVSARNFVDVDTREVKVKHPSLWTMCFCRPSTK